MEDFVDELAQRSVGAINDYVAYFGEGKREEAIEAVVLGAIKAARKDGAKVGREDMDKLREENAGYERENSQLRALRDNLNEDRTELMAAVVMAMNKIRDLEMENVQLSSQIDLLSTKVQATCGKTRKEGGSNETPDTTYNLRKRKKR